MGTVGVDTGGTFTDFVAVEGERETVLKLPSTPADPGAAVAEGLARLGDLRRVVHGTTVALNAVLTGDLARTALVGNAGLVDVLAIGRQQRPELYALEPDPVACLVPAALRFGVRQRTWPDPDTGEPLRVEQPEARELAALARRVAKSGAESIAVCLVHSYLDPGPERELAEALRGLGLPITLSAELVPEHREVERFSTAVLNAALRPRMERYLSGLAGRLGGAELLLLQSIGGTLAAERAAREPVRVLLSGPAGGVLGAARAAAEAGIDGVLTLDLGGTSADVAFHRGGPAAAAVERGSLCGHPLAVPTLDVHTIGCGGGSLLRLDAGGALRVGPQSAGADPGPIAYGRGEEPTLTDAHFLLGHLGEGAFLGGGLELDPAPVVRAFERLGRRLGTDAAGAARAAVETARAAMRRAMAVMSLERGLDPARLPLVAFGGGGGLHAAALADLLGLPSALVPRHPGALSAAGMAAAVGLAEVAQSVLEPLDRVGSGRRRALLAELAREAREILRADGERGRLEVEGLIDLRYVGQSYELRLADGPRLAEDFHAAHERLYGYALRERPIELVAARVRARRLRPIPPPAAVPRARLAPAGAFLGSVPMDFGRSVQGRRAAREALPPGAVVAGPARIEEYTGTTLVPPGWQARVAAGGHLLLERSAPRAKTSRRR